MSIGTSNDEIGRDSQKPENDRKMIASYAKIDKAYDSCSRIVLD